MQGFLTRIVRMHINAEAVFGIYPHIFMRTLPFLEINKGYLYIRIGICPVQFIHPFHEHFQYAGLDFHLINSDGIPRKSEYIVQLRKIYMGQVPVLECKVTELHHGGKVQEGTLVYRKIKRPF